MLYWVIVIYNCLFVISDNKTDTLFICFVVGLLCVHLLRTFMHLLIDRIPSKYILQRYTYSARQDVTFQGMIKI
jgi:hypothetical protein